MNPENEPMTDEQLKSWYAGFGFNCILPFRRKPAKHKSLSFKAIF